MYRVAVVASHPIQYQAPWFRALAKVVDLDVFFCHKQDATGQAHAGFGVAFEWDIPLLGGYRHHWLTNVAASPDVSRFAGCDTPEIASRLASGHFDGCIVSGWYLKSYVQAIRACWRQNIRVLVRGDSHLKTPRSPVKTALKHLPYRWFLNRIDAHLFVGAANKRYLQSYGVAANRLFFAPHFVDNAFFSQRAAEARQNGARERLRGEWGAGADETVFMYTGKLIDKKRVADFVKALAVVKQSGRIKARGVIVGSGPLEAELRTLARTNNLEITFAGFQNQTALPACYAAADALVLPSDGGETWGLVVNEALACGVPAIVSDEVGCADDLVHPGRTGFIFKRGDVAQLADRMTMLVDAVTKQGVEMWRRASQEAVRPYCADAAAVAVLQALDAYVPAEEAPCPVI